MNELPLPCDMESERLILGALLAGQADFGLLSLGADDFSTEAHRRIYRAIEEVHALGSAIDRITVYQALARADWLESVGGLTRLTELDANLPPVMNLDAYVSIVRDKSTLRRAIGYHQQAIEECFLQTETPTELLQKAERVLNELAIQGRPGGDLASVLEAVLQNGGPLAFTNPGSSAIGIKTPWPRLNEKLEGGGLLPGQMVTIGARPSLGKAQPLSESVLCADGNWKSFAAVKAGDRIASHDESQSFVREVYPQGIKPIFEVTFSDGRSTRACGEHLWAIHYRQWEHPRTVDTHKLADMLTKQRYRGRISIDTPFGEWGQNPTLPIHPWLLGYLLGNAYFGSGTPRVTIPVPELIPRVQYHIDPFNLVVKHSSKYDYQLVQRNGKRKLGAFGVTTNPLKAALSLIGIAEPRCFEKRIPDHYLRLSRTLRMELLRGLLDSDGTIGKNGSGIGFCSSSCVLASQVMDLARSVGCIAKMRQRATPQYTYKGIKKNGRDAFQVDIRPTCEDKFFYHPRKAARMAIRPTTKVPRLNVVSVLPSGSEECSCISVTHPSGLYVTKDYVVTHNTSLGCQMALSCALGGVGTAFFSLEMSTRAIVTRLACTHAQVDSLLHSQGKTNHFEREEINAALRILTEDAKLWLSARCYTLPAMRRELLRLSAKEQVRLIVIDYLQLMEPTGSAGRNRTEQISELSRGVKRIAEEFKCSVVLLSQLNRDMDRENRAPRLSDLRDGGSVEQDSDIVLLPHRLPNQADHIDEIEVDLLIAKQRNGALGRVPLLFRRRYTKFSERL